MQKRYHLAEENRSFVLLKKIPPSGRDKAGYRLRGEDVSRLENFCDAVFGFSLTMVIVSDQNVQDFAGSLWRIPAFFICFCTLFALWFKQQCFFRRFGLADVTTTMLTGLMLFSVMVLVFPLRYIVYLSVEALQHHSPDRTGGQYVLAATYYMLCMALNVLCLSALHMHVLLNAKEVGLEEQETVMVKLEITRGLTSVVVLGLAATSVVFLHRGAGLVGTWGVLFAVLLVARRIATRVFDRHRRKHAQAGAAPEVTTIEAS